jgi:hypothetical protein
MWYEYTQGDDRAGASVLLRLELLAEIGRFKSLRHKAPQLTKLSLVYGRNAQGKSTVCAVLGSAALSDPRLIATRNSQAPWRED